jgi:hypothetical protein
MTRWPSGENRGENDMQGKLPTLPGLDVEQVDPRIALAELHIGDFLGRRREPRRQHQIGALGQVPHIGTVLIHQRQPLDPTPLRAGLVDEHHAAVEITLLAGQTFVDLVGDDVRDPAPVFRRGEILLAGELLAGVDVPQAELGLEPAVALPGHASGHQCLRVDLFPTLELWRGVDIGDALDEGGLIDRREQSAALEIIGDDLRHADADLGISRRSRHEIRDRDRQRHEFPFLDGDPFRSLRQRIATAGCGAERGHSGNDLPAAQAERHVGQSIFVGHGFKLCSYL